MKLFRIMLFLCLVTTSVKAQFVTNSKRAADVYFHNKEYYAAAEYYKKALNISTDSIGFVVPVTFENKIKEGTPKRAEYEYCVFQLASSLRLYKDFRGAEAWYAVAKNFSDPKYILSGFYYGESLRANQKFKEAIDAFEEFLKKDKNDEAFRQTAKIEIESCNFALYEMRYPRLYKFSKLVNQINDKGSNYTPVISHGNFYFTSSRPVAVGKQNEVFTDSKTKDKVIKSENPYINAIYKAMGNPQQENAAVQKIGTVEKGKEYAAPAFHPNGKIMYLTSWTAKGTKKISAVDISRGNADSWSEPKELGTQVNVEGFNSMQPFVTKDGKYLIFASDRPGGIGKLDLWYCVIRVDGSLGNAVNLGRTINTPEDDVAPYYNVKNKTLLYSSAGRIGMGGLDFYESVGDFGKWTEPRNLGYPFNSSKDDVYFTPLNSSDTEGYISSDRESVCCLEIFYVKKEFITIEGVLLDCKTNLPLNGGVVTLADSSKETEMTVGEDGRFKFDVSSNRALTIKAKKENYFTKVIHYNYEELAKADTLINPKICLEQYKLNVPIVLNNVLYDFNSADLTDASKVILDHLYQILFDNPTMEIELSAHTDNIGTAAYNFDLSDRRAKSCVDYLVSKGISAERMTSRGFGFTKPIAPNQFKNGKDNFEGRQLNRRTEFKVTKK